MNNLKNKDQQKGSVLILLVMMIVVLLSFSALSIDVGYIYLMRTQLQRAADAAALAGAAELPDSAAAITAAQQYANSNMPGQGTILSSSNIVIGIWDPVARTLTASSINPTAISVKASRTQAKGNPVSLFFAAIFGITKADVTASATAQAIYPKPDYNLIGMTNIKMTGSGTVDSYDSSVGSYSNTRSERGDIATNGNITLTGTRIIYGDARPGIGGSVTTLQKSVVMGSKAPLTKALNYPPVAPPSSYNNNGFGPSLIVSGTVNLPPGTYYFTTLKSSGTSQLVISGPTTIYISSTLDISGSGITNTTTNANNLNLFFTSTATTANLTGSSNFYGSIYGPSIDLSISGTTGFYGSFIADNVNITGSGGIHLDKSFKLPFLDPTVELVK